MAAKTIENRLFVKGTDVASLTEGQVFNMIEALKSEGKRLKDALPEGVTSARVTRLIAENTAAITALVGYLDAMEAPADEAPATNG